MSGYIRHSLEDIKYSSESPFGNDELKRAKFAQLLTSVVSNYNRGFVMAVNGSWGTGKTVFMNQWLLYLRKQGFRATILNAWDNDYFNEPTLSVLSQFSDFFEERGMSESLKAALQAVKNVPGFLIKSMLLKLVADYVGEEAVASIKSEYNKHREHDVHYQQMDIDAYVQSRNEFSNYQRALIQFANEASEEGKPLVFIIDELDRCRPFFAIEVLEKIKHLFNIPNIVFCLAIDKEQLKHTIQGYYGSANFAADDYLRRFFDIEFEMPPIDHYKFGHIMSNHYELSSLIYNSRALSDFIQISTDITSKLNLTLRQVEKFYAHAKLVFSYYHSYNSEWLIGVMLIINKFFSELFIGIVEKRYKLHEYAIKLKPILDCSDDSLNERFGSLLYRLNEYLYPNTLGYTPANFQFDWVDDFSENQIESMSSGYRYESTNRNMGDSLKTVIDKILFLEQFIQK